MSNEPPGRRTRPERLATIARLTLTAVLLVTAGVVILLAVAGAGP